MRPHTFLRLAAATGLAALLAAGAPARAGVITYAYSGLVDQDDAGRGYAAFSGQFSYESTTPDLIADPQTADYKMGFWPLGMNVVFDGGAASASIGETMDILVTNDAGGMDQVGALARSFDLSNALSLSLFDDTALLLGSDALPGGQLSFADFGWASFEWDSADGTLQGHLTGLSCIGGCDIVVDPGSAPPPTRGLPEPGAVPLVLASLAALGCVRRRRPRND